MERKSMLALCGPPIKRKVSDNSAMNNKSSFKWQSLKNFVTENAMLVIEYY